MSTEFFNDQWRIPSNENQNKVSNYSMEFDGTSDFIDLGTDILFDSTKGFSFSAWVNLDSYSPAFPGICRIKTDQSKGFIIFLSQTSPYQGVNIGSVSGFMRAKTVGNIGGDFIGNWKHICLTFDGVDRTNTSSYKIYVDGSSVDLTTTGAFSDSPNANFLGNATTNSATYLNGKIDQVSVFDYELPATGTNSVATLYGGGTALINPMALSPVPIYYAQLGDQSVSTGPTADYLVPNNSLQDYVFNFDGIDDYIDLGTSSILGNSSIITLSAWFNPSVVVNNYGPFIGIRETGNTFPYQLGVSDTTKVRFIISESVGTFKFILGNDVLSINNWYHAVAVANGTDLRLYINGVLQNDIKTYSATLVTPTSNILIGRQTTSSSAIFNGELSNISMWDTNLSSAQITTIYNNGSPNDISSLNPVSWWKLNAQDTFDAPDWTINDYGSGDNDGTSNGMDSSNLVVSDLQQTSGYSPYALSLDSSNANSFTLDNGGGNGLLNAATSFTISAWINPNQPSAFGNIFTHFAGGVMLRFNSSGNIQLYATKENNTFPLTTAFNALTFTGNWHHVVGIYDSSFLKIYVDNVLVNTPLAFSDTLKNDTSSMPDIIGNRFNTTQFFDGEISNVAVWKNSVIDVNTLYNQGLPADLTSLNPSGWWQMGSNSSFDASTSKWTCLNEGIARTSTIPSNATTLVGNMTNDQITNGVGYSANGLGESTIEIIGDAPYSSGNGLSNSMDVLDRIKDVPPT